MVSAVHCAPSEVCQIMTLLKRKQSITSARSPVHPWNIWEERCLKTQFSQCCKLAVRLQRAGIPWNSCMKMHEMYEMHSQFTWYELFHDVSCQASGQFPGFRSAWPPQQVCSLWQRWQWRAMRWQYVGQVEGEVSHQPKDVLQEARGCKGKQEVTRGHRIVYDVLWIHLGLVNMCDSDMAFLYPTSSIWDCQTIPEGHVVQEIPTWPTLPWTRRISHASHQEMTTKSRDNCFFYGLPFTTFKVPKYCTSKCNDQIYAHK